MNILFLLSWKYPGYGAASKRITNYKNGLSAEGNKIEIKSIYSLYKNPSQSLINGLLMPLLTIIELLKNKNKTDIILVYGFGWISKLIIVFYGKIHHIKVVFEVNEKPYSIVGSRRDYVLKYFFGINTWFLTRLVYPLTDGFVVISENLEKFVSTHKSPRAKIVKIPIIVDYDSYQTVTANTGGIKPYIFHSATLNDNKDGISDVIEALGLVIRQYNQPLHFYLTSRSALEATKAKVQQIIANYNIGDYIHYLGDLDEETLQGYQKNCDLVVINKVDSEQNRYNFATKIGEYCALGKPIITTEVGEVSNYFNDGVNCMFIPQHNPHIIAEKIMYLLNNPDVSQKIGEEARITASNEFDYKVNGVKLHDFFESVLNNN